MSAAFREWQATQRPGPNTILDYGCQVRRFISIRGDLAIGDITREHIKSFGDQMLAFPRGVPRSLQDAPVPQVIAWAERQGAPTIAVTTINDKCIGALSAILALFVEQGILPANVTGHARKSRRVHRNRTAERSITRFKDAVGRVIDLVTPTEAATCFASAGYNPTWLEDALAADA